MKFCFSYLTYQNVWFNVNIWTKKPAKLSDNASFFSKLFQRWRHWKIMHDLLHDYKHDGVLTFQISFCEKIGICAFLYDNIWL